MIGTDGRDLRGCGFVPYRLACWLVCANPYPNTVKDRWCWSIYEYWHWNLTVCNLAVLWVLRGTVEKSSEIEFFVFFTHKYSYCQTYFKGEGKPTCFVVCASFLTFPQQPYFLLHRMFLILLHNGIHLCWRLHNFSKMTLKVEYI